MITPRWVSTPCQPIGVRNVLHYLVAALEEPATIGETFDIGQEEVIHYRRLMEIYAEEAGLPRRIILPIPLLTPRLSSYWIHLVTPVPAAIAHPLAEGLSNPVVCRDVRIRSILPQRLVDCREAIRLALERVRQQQVETSWADSGRLPPVEWSLAGDPQWAGGTVYEDSRRILLAGLPAEIWPAVLGIGGATGWYFADWLWHLRGWLDRLVGGVGLGRGRRSARDLRPGDVLDFWRVLAIKKEAQLLLGAEMKLPGEATLAFTLRRTHEGTELRQTARFLPRGLWGILYWHAVTPFHHYVFNGMLNGIAAAAATRVISGPQRVPPRSAVP